jgi:four helix bundle protein
MGRGEQFEDLVVWQRSMALLMKIYGICRKAPLVKDWGLRDQLQRAAVSVPANIAEGYERSSRKEYIQFINVAKGSVGELRCLLRIASLLQYVPEETATELIEESAHVARMLKGLANSLKRAQV